MAIELKNSVFIHVPKCGGRSITQILQRFVPNYKVLGDVMYDAHDTPDTDKQVFGFIRHPATFIHSIWTHRARKKANKFGHVWNWQPYLRLESECGDQDYNKFVENILNGKDYVLDYYMHYLGKYNNPQIGKMENLLDDLIKFLKENNEDFDEDGIKNYSTVHGANNKSTNKPVSLSSSMNEDQIKKLVNISEKKLCEEFKYEI